MAVDTLVIRGAAVHNLRHVDLDLPRHRLIVVTGVSGSGKSSLAFDTIYAEGQRRYVECLSAYARQFLERMDKPAVELIDGLSPAVSVDRRGASTHPRSTVGTLTEVHDYLRLLFARAGEPHCPRCGDPIRAQTVQEMADRVLGLPDGTKLTVLAPVVRGRRGAHRALVEDLARRGFVRARIDGALVELAEAGPLAPGRVHDVEVVVDRLSIRPGIKTRLTDALETSLELADGLVLVEPRDGDAELSSSRYTCPRCGTSLGEVSPRTFSFNGPQGACPECDGLGARHAVDPDRVVRDPAASLADGALRVPDAGVWRRVVRAFADAGRRLDVDVSRPWRELPEAVRRELLGGVRDADGAVVVEGVVDALERRYRTSGSERVRGDIQATLAAVPCPACRGARLRPESLAVRVGGWDVASLSALSIVRARTVLAELAVPAQARAVVEPVRREIDARLELLATLGLDYLSLDRGAPTLSSGEAQRIRLATQVGARLSGVLYVLDEPSEGLHPRDHARLLDTLRELRDRGNTVLVVEHDADAIRAADVIVDLGPGAGEHGGRVVACGDLDAVLAAPESLTGAYLSGRLRIEPPVPRRPPATATLGVRGASQHNLRDVDVDFPLGRLVAVTGVSGSGKSTLVDDVLLRAVARRLGRAVDAVGAHRELVGVEAIDRVIAIDSSPIGRTPRSNAATYTGLFATVRERFALVPEARARGYTASRFSFNVPGGRCAACSGDGVLRVEMHFLPDVHVTCATCGGRRYNRETLEIRYKGVTVADVLDTSVDRALELFENVPQVRDRLVTLRDVGLGYLRLGQPGHTLSGGEAQRIKLSRELARRDTGRTLYVLDEPTTGLHFDDVRKLLAVLHSLVERGNTVVVIEHDLDVVRCADHVIDLGPEGGERGGRVVAAGPPEAIARCQESITGRYLRRALGDG